MPLLIAADAFTKDISHEDRYYFGSAAPYHTPVLIVAGGQEGPYGATTWGPWERNGVLYTLLENGFIFSGIYSSSDNGATWTELDSANHIASGVSTPCFDGDHTVIVAYRVAGAGQQPIRLKNFDLVTGTWGADYATASGPSCTQLGTVALRPDGTVFVLYDNAPPTPIPPASNMLAAVFSQASAGGTWTVTALDVGTNFAQLPGWVLTTRIITSQSSHAMDSTGRLHFVMWNPSSGLFGYQAVEANNTLGAFHQFTDNLDAFSGTPLGHPVIIGATLVIPIVINNPRHYATLYTATPLNAPVFSLMPSPGIDPSEAPGFDNNPDNVPDLAYDGTTLYAIWPRTDGDGSGNNFAQLRLAETTNADPTMGWSAQTIFDLAIDSPPGFNFAGQEIQIPSIGFFAAARTPFVPTVTTGGGPYVIPKPCLCDIEDLAWKAIREYRERKGAWPYPWTDPPPGAIRVTAPGVIPVPTVLAGETQGLLYKVDQGFQFALVALVVEFFGGALLPGDFTWSLDVNKPVGVGSFQGMPVQGFTRVDVPLGSLEIPWPLEAPDIYNPNDVLRTKFFNVNLAPGAPNFLKSILLGWRWPVQ